MKNKKKEAKIAGIIGFNSTGFEMVGTEIYNQMIYGDPFEVKFIVNKKNVCKIVELIKGGFNELPQCPAGNTISYINQHPVDVLFICLSINNWPSAIQLIKSTDCSIFKIIICEEKVLSYLYKQQIAFTGRSYIIDYPKNSTKKQIARNAIHAAKYMIRII